MHISRSAVLICSALLYFVSLTPARAAEPPRTIAFQGVLKDANGKPVTTTKSVTFTLYDAATEGNAVWTETKDITPSAGGLFTTALGSKEPLTGIPFYYAYWVGVTINPDIEMVPRTAMHSVPYALALPEFTLDTHNRMTLAKQLILPQGNGIVLQAMSLAPGTPGDIEFRNDNESLKARIRARPDVDDLQFFTGPGASPRVVIDNNGKVGIGTTSPTSNLDVNGTASCNTLTLTSSRRYKEDIQPINNALGTISRLQGVRYNWDAEHGGKPDFGFVAEDVAKVIPELVTMEPDGKAAQGMDYSHLTALTVEGIKEQQVQIQDQQTRIRALENENADLRARLDRLEALIPDAVTAGRAQ